MYGLRCQFCHNLVEVLPVSHNDRPAFWCEICRLAFVATKPAVPMGYTLPEF